MPRVLRTRQAETDVLEIWIFIAEDSIRAADGLLDRFEQVFHTLSTQPRMGRRRPELSPDLRSFPVGDYLVFYEPLDDGIQLIRVLSGYRDIESLFQ